MSDKPNNKTAGTPTDPALAEPKFHGVPRQGPGPSPDVARRFSQEHDRAAEDGRLGSKPGPAGKPAKKG
jgi:hypothetical protein